MRKRQPRYLYIAKSGPYVKVGSSTAPLTRVKRLASDGTKRPELTEPVTLLHAVRGGFPAERALHRSLKANRITGEWYSEGCMTSPKIRALLRMRPNFGHPRKRTHMGVSISAQLHSQIVALAKTEGRMIQAVTNRLLADGMDNWGKV